MDEISELWEDLKFEAGSIGNELLPKDRQEVYIGMGDRNADILFVGNDPKLYLAEDYKVESKSSGAFLIRLLDVVEYLPETYYITTLSKREIKIKNFNEEERKKLIDLLFMQILLISPKIVVFLGKEVAQLVENKEIDFKERTLEMKRGQFKKWRGDIETYLTYDVETVIKARNDSGKKAVVALNFFNDIKNVKERLNHYE